MTATHYAGSRGPVPIATMPYPHLLNAHSKLMREGDPARAAEVEAMTAQLAKLDAENAELSEERGDEPAPLGHNQPPADEPAAAPSVETFEAIKVHCDDIYAEGKHWLDGGEITSDAEHDAVELLLDMARKAFDAADDARVRENKPFDDGKAAVQAKYAPLIAETKKTTGSMVRLKSACPRRS